MVDINLLAVEIVAVEAGAANDINLFIEYLHFLCIFEFDGKFFLIAQKIKTWQIIAREDQNIISIDCGERQNFLSDGQVLSFIISEDG